ncbi:MAG: GNAT family N-acetyltransferase [Candidatus Izemoplasmatales bacterium]|nr:GNAT family N-acetyltransferase [Candidatus Izemoplasmatales bacterium]
MNQITFRIVEEDNFQAIIDMSKTLDEYQSRCVAPNVVSLAQAYLYMDIAWPRAIYLDETPIGFVMLDVAPEDVVERGKAYYLWRLMISFEHQGKGYGKIVLDMLVEKCKQDGKVVLYTSCEMEKSMPYAFYINYGFIDTGIMDEGEEVLKLNISSNE